MVEYKKFRNSLTNRLRVAEKTYYKTMLEEHNKQPGQTMEYQKNTYQ